MKKRGQVVMVKSCPWFHVPLVLVVGFMSAFLNVRQCFGRIRKLKQSLEPKELEKYNQVSKERQTIYTKAMLLSLLLALTYLFVCWGSASMYYQVSNMMAIFLTGIYIFYTIAPKKHSMILENNLSVEETKNWYRVYLCMETSFWKAFVSGCLLAAVVLMVLDMTAGSSLSVSVLKMKTGKNNTKRK